MQMAAWVVERAHGWQSKGKPRKVARFELPDEVA
jgi:hypothetical protein